MTAQKDIFDSGSHSLLVELKTCSTGGEIMPCAGSLAAFLGLVRSWTVEKNPLPPLF